MSALRYLGDLHEWAGMHWVVLCLLVSVSAALGFCTAAVLHCAGDADDDAARFAEVDRLAEQRRRSERAARVEANCDNGAVDDSMFV